VERQWKLLFHRPQAPTSNRGDEGTSVSRLVGGRAVPREGCGIVTTVSTAGPQLLFILILMGISHCQVRSGIF
jgi:hypothetical protein